MKLIFNLLRQNYLLGIDFFLRIVLSVFLPKLFTPETYAEYNYLLALFFWFLILDFGSSMGFSLRIVKYYRPSFFNLGYLLSSFAFSVCFTSVMIFFFFILINNNEKIHFFSFLGTFFILSLYSFLSTTYKCLGLINTDFIGRIVTSLSLIIILVFGKNFYGFYYILIPYLLAVIFYSISILKVNYFVKFPTSIFINGFKNIKSGFNLYTTNALLIAFSLMDKVVFTQMMSLELYGNYLFCYSLSSLHVLVQGLIASKYYRVLLSTNSEDDSKKMRLFFITSLGHVLLSGVIIFIVNISIFKQFYSRYSFINSYIVLTESICIAISFLTLIYLILGTKKINRLFLFISYCIPFCFMLFFKIGLFSEPFLWPISYLFELTLALFYAFKYLKLKINIIW